MRSSPSLAEAPEELTAANAATGMMEGLGILVGPAINAALIVGIGPGGVVGVMTLFMVAATLLVIRLRLYRDVEHQPLGPGAGSFLQDAVGGLRELQREPGAALLLGRGWEPVLPHRIARRLLRAPRDRDP